MNPVGSLAETQTRAILTSAKYLYYDFQQYRAKNRTHYNFKKHKIPLELKMCP